METYPVRGSKNEIFLLFGSALRYSLGRKTYITDTVANLIRNNLHLFNKMDLNRLVDDIIREEQYNNLGDDHIDKPIWLELKKDLKEILNNGDNHTTV